MSIKGFKLVTGEEVISESTISGDGRALLKNPMQLRVVPPKINGAPPSMGFVPFPAFADQSKEPCLRLANQKEVFLGWSIKNRGALLGWPIKRGLS